MYLREELVVWRVRLSAPGFHTEVAKDRAKMNEASSAVISAVTPSQRKTWGG